MDKTIYALIDPRTGDVRYVGASVDLHRRVGEHLCRSKRLESYSARWIRQLLDEGLRPCVWQFAVADDGWEEVECYWINVFRGLFDLTNIMDGGQGASAGVPKPLSTRLKMTEAATGRVLDAATRAKIGAKASARRQGQKWSLETKVKMSLAQQARRERERLATATMES
jgi:hypothetical protein